MNLSDGIFEARLRRSYEAGRLGGAVLGALPLVPLIALATTCCGWRTQVVVVGAMLCMTIVALRWRGERYAVGVLPGLVAGLGPLIAPVAAHLFAWPCGIGGCDLTTSICAAGGLLGGVLLGLLAPRPAAERGVPFVVACLVAALTGAVGCLTYGLIGLVVMAAGLATGALPVFAVRRAA